MKESSLPVIEDCSGCGVCCFHMGYPAFMLPRKPFSRVQIDSDPECQDLLRRGWTKEELLNGIDGESYWQELPEDLRSEWLAFVASYKKTVELDGPCFWLDLETRMCKHHLHRPSVCRDFEAGSKECHDWRKHYKSKISAAELE